MVDLYMGNVIESNRPVRSYCPRRGARPRPDFTVVDALVEKIVNETESDGLREAVRKMGVKQAAAYLGMTQTISRLHPVKTDLGLFDEGRPVHKLFDAEDADLDRPEFLGDAPEGF